MKIAFDTTLVIGSIILSLLFLGFVDGVREGTLAAAFFVGIVAKYVNKPMSKLVKKWVVKHRKVQLDSKNVYANLPQESRL